MRLRTATVTTNAAPQKTAIAGSAEGGFAVEELAEGAATIHTRKRLVPLSVARSQTAQRGNPRIPNPPAIMKQRLMK